MLAAIFVPSGWDAMVNPGPKVPVANDVAPKVSRQLPGLASLHTESLVRVNGAVQVGAGTLLALGRFPRTSALVLAGSLVPTTLAAHRYWEYDEPTQRQQQRIHFLKNISLLGGLLIAWMDTEGRPSLTWRAEHQAKHAKSAAEHRAKHARSTAEHRAKHTRGVARRGRRQARRGRRQARLGAKAARGGVRSRR